jgi:hypothetical protein
MFYYYHAEYGYAECRYAGCDFAEYRYAGCDFAECRYAGCHFAEYHGVSVTLAIENVTNGDTLAYNRAKDSGFVYQFIPSL